MMPFADSGFCLSSILTSFIPAPLYDWHLVLMRLQNIGVLIRDGIGFLTWRLLPVTYLYFTSIHPAALEDQDRIGLWKNW